MIRSCQADFPTFVSHSVPIPPCCPVSANPLFGSKITICYRPHDVVFPVEDLASFVAEYVGGRGMVRGMEEMIQDLAARVAGVVKVSVRAYADLLIAPPYGGDQQSMRVSVRVRVE